MGIVLTVQYTTDMFESYISGTWLILVCDERKLSDYLHIVGSEQDCPDSFKNHMETLLYSCLSKVGICTQLLFFLVRFSIDFQT
jgi:hypothetical protein